MNLIYSFVRRGLKVREVEVPWSHEEGGSKVSRRLLKVSVMMFLSLVKLRTWYSPLRWILHTKIYLITERTILKVLR